MEYLDVSQLNTKTDKILGYVTAFYMAMIYVNLGVSCLILFKELISNIMRRLKKDEEERLKKLADAKDKVDTKIDREKLRQAQQEYSQIKVHKTTTQDRSIFFRQDGKPLIMETKLTKVVRIKRGQECQ
jgi:hypothetical protein